jgi:hypothetical protein
MALISSFLVLITQYYIVLNGRMVLSWSFRLNFYGLGKINPNWQVIEGHVERISSLRLVKFFLEI